MLQLLYRAIAGLHALLSRVTDLGCYMSKSLQIKQLDALIRPFVVVSEDLGLRSGWVATVRQAMGMPVRALASRLGVAPSQITRSQQREASGAITVASLRRLADALECDLMYGFVPRGGSFRGIVERQARVAATERLQELEQTMRLEHQVVEPDEHQRQLDELTAELTRSRPAWIWDAPRRR